MVGSWDSRQLGVGRRISIGNELKESPQLVKEQTLGTETVKDHRQHQPRVEYFIEEALEEFDECEEEREEEVQANSPVSSHPILRSIRRSIPVYPAKSQPPSKGRKRQLEEEVEKVFVDSALYEFAAPQTLENGVIASTSKAGRRLRVADNRMGADEEELVEPKPARNLDWIIDAIAEGKSVDKASPHSRRQATFHTCEHCGLELKYPSKIAAHMRTHTKEKPFKCEICGAGFAQNTTLRMHLRRHLDQKPYHCPDAQCGQRFINGGLLNAHIQKRHMQPRRTNVDENGYNLRVHTNKIEGFWSHLKNKIKRFCRTSEELKSSYVAEATLHENCKTDGKNVLERLFERSSMIYRVDNYDV